MTELISYTKDDFMKVKEVSEVCPETKSVYEDLFARLDCFNSTFVVKQHFKRSGDPIRPHRHQPQGLPPPHRRSFLKPSRKIINNGDSCHIRKAKSILNIINASNFEKLSNKLKFVVSDDNVHEIVPLVFEVGVQQRFYIGIFIKVLLGLANEYGTAVEAYAERFVSTFLNNVLSQEIEGSDAMSEYDRFCAEQKFKQHRISSGVMALHLINAGLLKMSIQEFTDALVSACKEKKTDSVFDVVLNILAENKSLNGWKAVVLRRDELKGFAHTTKLRFMLDDIFGQR